MLQIKEELKALCETEGITGFENKACQKAEQLFRPYCDKTEMDDFGNLFVYRFSRNPEAKTVLLDAHIDQIGFMITDVLPGGFLRFTQVGGVDPRMLLGCEVTVLAEQPYYGIISCMPPHLMKAGEQDKAVPMHEMVIDTGLLEAKDKIKIGTPVVYRTEMCSLSPDSITGKCLDDRAGVIALLSVMEQLKDIQLPFHLIAMVSSQEEVTSLGATIGTYRLRPDYAIAVDVGHAKTPDTPAGKAFAFGGGPMIGMGPNLNTRLTKALIRTAKTEDIPYQLEVMEGATGTNAWDMQVVACGTAMGLVSIPLKYMHTQIETIRISDLQAVADLIYHFLRNFKGEVRL